MATHYQLPPLPYDYAALEPYIDAMTMNVHHKGHHQTYVNNLNAALDKAPQLRTLSLPDLLASVGTPMVSRVRCPGNGQRLRLIFALSETTPLVRWTSSFRIGLPS